MHEGISHHSELSDMEFVDQVFLLSINPSLFDHEAHIRFAWLVLTDFSYEKAVNHIHESIKGLDQKYGDGTKYHATITQALIEILRLRLNHEAIQYLNFKDFISENGDLLSYCKELLLRHYSQELLFSDEAKQAYVEPNRKQF